MDPLTPRAEAVAVQDGRIRAVGSLDEVIDELKAGGVEHRVDDSFGDQVILPGLIEAHSHAVQLGVLWRNTYVGANDRIAPDGSLQTGSSTVDAVVARLKQAHARLADPDAPLVAWGYDPALIPGTPSLGIRELDAVSSSRPIAVINMSGHISYVNSVVLSTIGYDRSTDIVGLIKDANGELTGELQETRAMLPTARYYAADDNGLDEALRLSASLALRVGCTTISEMTVGVVPGGFEALQRAGADPTSPVRISAYVFGAILDQMGMEAYQTIREGSHDHLRTAGVKLVVDGSIQGFTANLRWPYYYDGHPNGISNIDPKTFVEQVHELHAHGIQLSLHVNGDAAIDVALDALAEAQQRTPRIDVRHRLEHVQIVDDRQLGRMAQLGLVPNFFVNHIYYWGDFHASRTVGPVRAARMNPLASAQRHGLRFSLHSDSWVTPIDPLHAVWVAAVRRTSSGKELGRAERISVADGLRAVTIDAAHILGEDDVKGSIERGKYADLTVLDAEPSDNDPDALLDIKVQATVLGGRVHPVPPPAG